MTKEQLRQYRSIKLEHTRLGELIREMEETLYGVRATCTDGQPRGGGTISRPTEDVSVKHVMLRQTYEAKRAELYDAMGKIEAAIESLPSKERTLIRAYYAEGMTWEAVCVEMNYSWRQVHRIHAKALQLLNEEDKTQ